jgi:TfoX/Sxy family transcriptional regulator of competence genes
MAYNEPLAQRIRTALDTGRRVEEQTMFGGLAFMVEGKMCVGVLHDELMVRFAPALQEIILTKPGCHLMEMMAGKPMRGYVLVHSDALQTAEALDYWLELALAYNPVAQASKKRSGKKA